MPKLQETIDNIVQINKDSVTKNRVNVQRLKDPAMPNKASKKQPSESKMFERVYNK